MSSTRAGETAQWLEHRLLPRRPDSIPSTHTVVCNCDFSSLLLDETWATERGQGVAEPKTREIEKPECVWGDPRMPAGLSQPAIWQSEVISVYGIDG